MDRMDKILKNLKLKTSKKSGAENRTPRRCRECRDTLSQRERAGEREKRFEMDCSSSLSRQTDNDSGAFLKAFLFLLIYRLPILSLCVTLRR